MMWRSILTAGLLGIAAGVALASGPSIEAFFKIRTPSRPHLLPDGTLLVVDWPDGINQLYARGPAEPLDAQMRRLTDFSDGISGYTVSPDGSRVIVSAAPGGNEQSDLYLLDPVSGRLDPLLVNPEVVYRAQAWLDDSSGFIFTANDASPNDFHVYLHDFASGQSTRLLAEPGSWWAADVSPDGSRVLVSRYISASSSLAYELDARTGEKRDLTFRDGAGEPVVSSPVGYLPDGKSIAMISDLEQGIQRLYVLPAGGGEPVRPLGELDRWEIDDATISPEGDLLAVTLNEDGYAVPHVFALPEFRELSLPEIDRGVVSVAQLRGGRMVWTQSNAQTPGLAFAADLAAGGAPVPLTLADDQGIDFSSFALPRLVKYRAFDGREIPSFLFTPPGFEQGRPVPFVIMYHGGPEGQHRPGFNRTAQYLLSRGFGVMMPNVRGSTGYGREFHMLDNYTLRWDSVRDGVDAAQWLVDHGFAQPGRIAAWGGSYGGFMACAVLIEDERREGTNLFGASINSVGIVNFITFLEETKGYRRALREVEYGPLADPEFLASVSPINFIDQINAPMLISHGLNDPRVPVGEAMQLAVGLQKRGMDPELLFFHDEGHGLAKLENRLLFYRRAADFLDRTIASSRE